MKVRRSIAFAAAGIMALGTVGYAAEDTSNADALIEEWTAGYETAVYTGEEGGSTTDKFTILVGWSGSDQETSMAQEAMKEQLGIDYEIQYIHSDDLMTTLNLMVSSGQEMPDILLTGYNLEIEDLLVGADRVMNLTDVYSSEALPYISGIDDRIKDFIADESGELWWLPGWYAQEFDDPWGGWTVSAWYVRSDVMEEAGVTAEDLSTIEGMEDALRKFAELTDENGNNLIPLSFVQESGQENIILATFGVDTASGISGMPAVMKKDDEFVFIYDNPDFKAAYEWMNKMYNEGLIDMEVTTQKTERFQEKLLSGSVAAFTSDIWSANCYDESYDDDSVTYLFQPYDDPAVPGVTKGVVSYVNPNPQYMIFVNKDTEHLNAVMNFLNWCNEPNPIRQQEINEGPVGVYWDFVDGEDWFYTSEEYQIARDNADPNNKADTNLWEMTGYSNLWYPWFHQASQLSSGKDGLTQTCCITVGEFKNHRTIEDYDQVVLSTSSVLSENLSNLSTVVSEYTAKMIMAPEGEFDAIYEEFLSRLESRAKWSEMKEEWLEAYEEQILNN